MANIVKARLDATNKQIVLEVVDDTTGAAVTSWGSVTLKLGEDPGANPASPGTSMGQELEIRETIGCDPATGDPRYCFMLRSPWVTTALTTDPET
jgi:hypothetical protein